MSRLFVALDTTLGRRVVIKVLPRDLLTTASLARFRREIEITARLQHPHIVPILSSGSGPDDLLYYITPFIAGESLRERLAREGALGSDEIVRILREVASALVFAHGTGVIHRDVKPGNILLSEGHALLADFGIARAATGEHITRTETQPGTPAYMAPERPVDASADLYALGVVAHEMLTGSRPAVRVTSSTVVRARRKAGPPVTLIDRGLARIVARALAPDPERRFASAAELIEAVDHSTRLFLVSAGTRGLLAVAGLTSLALISATAVARMRDRQVDLSDARIVVIPAAASAQALGPGSNPLLVVQRFSDAFAQWRGLDVVSVATMSGALRGVDDSLPDQTRATIVARALGARNAVVLTPLVVRDSTRFDVTMYDASADTVLRTRSMQVPSGGNLDIQSLRSLVNALVRDSEDLPWTSAGDTRRPSLAAWRAIDSARVALERDELPRAEHLLRNALVADPGERAATWRLARVLDWQDNDATAAERATLYRRLLSATGGSALGDPDSLIAAGSLAIAERRYSDACELFRRVTAEAPTHPDGWTGLGDCQRRNSEVVRARTESGYAFRTSFHSAANAYERAIELGANKAPAFQYERLNAVLFTETSRVRVGMLKETGQRFRAYPALSGDTIAFIPYPATGVASARGIVPATRARALEENALHLRRVFEAWTQAAPRNAQAFRYLAEVLESLGNISESATDGSTALAAIRRARELEPDSLRKLVPVVIEVRQLVKNGDFTGARNLADSALTAWRNPPLEYLDFLVPLAALTGRRSLLARFLRQLSASPKYAPVRSDGGPIALPPALARERSEALASAALGVCDQQLQGFESRMTRLIEAHFPDSATRVAVAPAVLVRPLSLAAPCTGVAPLVRYAMASGDRLVRMQSALAQGDTNGLRAHFDTIAVQRRFSRPGDVAVDYTYAESWLLASMGDTTAALRRVELALDALPTMGPALIRDFAQTAGIVRAMTLCAELAAARHDTRSARRWADAVRILWSNADALLRPSLEKTERLASPPGPLMRE